MKIRFARVEDGMDIANVHVETWRSTYRGIMPDELLDNMSPAMRGNYWTEYLSTPPEGAFVLVAEEEGGGVVGFANAGPPRQEAEAYEYEGELYAIYLIKEQQGRGTGRKLMEAAARELEGRGMRSMMLWVMKDNAPSRRFYEGLGGKLLNDLQFELGGATLTAVGYGWSDVSDLYGRGQGRGSGTDD